MLDAHGADYSYREYTAEPLSEVEIRQLLADLGMQPSEVLRKRDKAYRELGLTGEEPGDELIRRMAEHPTLLERPIGWIDGRAVVGRPPERLLELL